MGGPAPSRLSVPDSARYHNSVFISTSVEPGSGDCPVQCTDLGHHPHSPILLWCTVQSLRTCGHPVFVSAAQYHLAVVYSNQRVINVSEAKNEFSTQNLKLFRIVKIYRGPLTRLFFTLQRMI